MHETQYSSNEYVHKNKGVSKIWSKNHDNPCQSIIGHESCILTNT